MLFRDEMQTVYTADTRNHERGARRLDRRVADLERGVSGRLDRMDRRWARSSRAVDGLRNSVSRLVLAGGLVALGAQATQVAKDFEAALNRVRAASGASQAEMAAIGAEARRLGQTTSFSAAEAASAIETLVRNGVRVPAILNGALEASLQLAEATGGDLTRSADLATDVMAQFGLGAGDLAGVVDTVTGAMINSKFGFDDFALAVGQGGAVAAQSGVEFEDFATAIAATAQAFTSGSDAGTSFKTFVTRLVGDGAPAKAAIKALGLEFFDAAGNLRPMREIAEELRVGLKDLTEEARTANLKTIFGTDAIRTAGALADQGAAGFDRLTVAIAGISAADQAEARLQGLEGASKRLAAAWEGLLLSIGDNGGLSATTEATEALAAALTLVANNLDLVLAGAVAVAGARGTGALIAALNAQRAATAALVVTRERELRVAQTARLAARQDAARRTARLADLERQNASTARVTKATRALAVANQQSAAATQAHAAAVANLAVAQARVATVTGLATRAMGGLRAVMGFFGGPVGLAITAVSVGIVGLSDTATEASTSIEALQARFQSLGGQIEKIRALDQELAKDTDTLTTANEALEGAIASQGTAAVDTLRVEVNAIRQRIAANQKLRQEYANVLRAQLAVAERDLATRRRAFRNSADTAEARRDFARDPANRVRILAGDPGAIRPETDPVFSEQLDGANDARRRAIAEAQSAGQVLSQADVEFLKTSAALSELEIQASQTRTALEALNAPAPTVGGGGVKTPPSTKRSGSAGRGGRTRGSASDLGRDIFEGSAERLQSLENERAAIGEVGAALAFLEERARLLSEAQQADLELTPQRIAQIESQAAVYGATKEQVDDLRAAEELLRKTAEANRTTEEKRLAIAQELEQLRPALIQLAGSEAAAQDVINKELERTSKLLGETGDVGKSVADALSSGLGDIVGDFDQADEAGKRLLLTLTKIALQAALTPIFERAGSFVGSILAGFDTGGYTGSGGRQEVAGIVHRDEYVVRSPFARQAMPLLDAINRGALRGFMAGGFVGAPAAPAPRIPSIQAAPSMVLQSVNSFHAHGSGAADPEDMMRVFQPELDRRDERIKAQTLQAVARNNRNDPDYLGGV